MIEFQYFKECPNASSTLENLRLLVAEFVVDEAELVLIEVPTPELAKELNFQGSPSILVDGIDIFTEQVPDGHSFNCRIYNIDGAITGILPEDYIKNQLIKLRSS